MNIFAMDTSTLTASVAVMNDQKLLGEFTASNALTHSQTIMPMTDSLLSALNMTLDDIDVFAVSVGPGSFTGLRIGMATVKTFAQVKQKPIIGVSSLRGVSENFSYIGSSSYICPIFDARRGEVYNALYLHGDEVVSDRALHIDDLLDSLSAKDVIFAGDAAILHRGRIEQRGEKGWRIAERQDILPRASSVAAYAARLAEKGEFGDPYSLRPKYLRKSQAERELEERQSKSQ